jgi:hypothetical protein
MNVQDGLAVLAAVGALCAAPALAQDDDWTNSRQSFLCRSNNEVREIKTYIFPPHEGELACRVDYIKNGKTSTLWSSRSSQSYCDGKASQLATRLSSGNFSCQPLHLQ